MDQKWSVKKLIRSIVLSRVYQLSSEHNADNYENDPANKFLWRMERRRLDAEEIRDAMLVASGQFDLERPDGSPVMELDNAPAGPQQGTARDSQAVQRAQRLPADLRGLVPEMLQVFDVADPNLIVGKRDVTTVPTQALFLMNNPFVLKQAEEMAKRILDQKDLNQATRIEMAYRLALGRLPAEQERAECAKVSQRLSPNDPAVRARRAIHSSRPGPASARRCFKAANFVTCIEVADRRSPRA